MNKISIIIPTYNRAELLPQAIDSVLNQNYKNFEIIVIDDCSEDRTKDVIDSYDDCRIKYHKHDINRGGSAARNTGIDIAQGKYIAFLDSDDKWKPDKLQKQIDYLQSMNEDWIAIHCGVEHKSDIFSFVDGFIGQMFFSKQYTVGGSELIPYILSGEHNFQGTSTLIVKSNLVEQINGFDERFDRHQDLEFLIRLLKNGKLAYVDKPLVEKRDTGMPKFDHAENGVDMLLKKFSKEINKAEKEGFQVTKRRYSYLSKLAFRQQKFYVGVKYFNIYQLFSISELIAILWSIVLGIFGFVQKKNNI